MTSLWACSFCADRRIYKSTEGLWYHALAQHEEKLPKEGDGENLRQFRSIYEVSSSQQRISQTEPLPTQPEPSGPNNEQSQAPLPCHHPEKVRQRVTKWRLEIWSLRSEVHEKRRELRKQQLAKSSAEDEYYKHMRLLMAGVSHQGNSLLLKSLEELRRDYQRASDEYGPLEDDFNLLEDQLFMAEFDLSEFEEKLCKRQRHSHNIDVEDLNHKTFPLISSVSSEPDGQDDLHALTSNFIPKLSGLDICRQQLAYYTEDMFSWEDQKASGRWVGLELAKDDQDLTKLVRTFYNSNTYQTPNDEDSLNQGPIYDFLRLVPEDFALRRPRLLWADSHFLDGWFGRGLPSGYNGQGCRHSSSSLLFEKPTQPRSDESPTVVNICSSLATTFSHNFDMLGVSLAGLFRRLLKRRALCAGVALISFPLPLTECLPLPNSTDGTSGGLAHFFQDSWRNFTDETAGPLIENIFLGIILLLLFYYIKSPKRDGRVLPYTHRTVAAGIFYLGMDERISNYKLAEFWIFTASLIMEDLNRRLAPFPASRRLKTLSITTLGFVSAAIPAYILAPPAGRYSDPLAIGIVALLPTTAFFSWFWDVALSAIKACLVWAVFIVDQLPLARAHGD